jgi:hypothetical protein
MTSAGGAVRLAIAAGAALRSAAAAGATQGSAAAAPAAPAWFMRLWRVVYGLLQRTGVAQVWPPRRKTAPVYLAGWLCVAGTMYFGFIHTGKSKEAEWEKGRKRDYVEASLKNLLVYEVARVKEAAEPSKDDAAVKEPAPAAAAAPVGETADETAARTKKEKDKEKEKKTPPDARKMLSLLWDEVEHGSITKIGIDRAQDWYQRAVGLLKERFDVELQEALDKTKLANGLPGVSAKTAWSSSPEAVEKVEEFKDGEKLLELLELVKTQVAVGFGKRLVDQGLVRQGRALVKLVSARRAAAVRRIWLLFRPHARKWVAGTVILMGTECMWGFLFGWLVSMANLAHDLSPDTMPRAARMGMMVAVGFLFNWPMDNLGDTLVDAVEAKMQLGLRSAVMESLLRQDREYFDHHQSGVLQERLNSDTEKLASTIIQQPKNLISALTRIVAKSAFLYHCSPGLFWLGISVPVPACAITIPVPLIVKLSQ